LQGKQSDLDPKSNERQKEKSALQGSLPIFIGMAGILVIF
jgi:hypothetical protein